MGKMSEVITGGGKIEALRRTQDGNIETFEVKGDAIDENGNWSIMIPMNLRKVITDEFGNIIPSPDGIKGIATEADFRFRISMDKSDSDKRLRQRAHFLVPNLTGNYNFKEYSKESLENSDDFVINEDLSIVTTNTPYENEKSNEYNYLEDFFTFRWKKVYTVKQYIGRFQKLKGDESRGFIGIKDIMNGEGVNKFPNNRIDTNFNPIYLILCLLLGLFASIVGIINGLIQTINGLVTMLCQLRIPVGVCLEYCFRLVGLTICSQDYKDLCSQNHPNCDPAGSNACNKCRCNGGSSGCGTKDSYFKVKLEFKCLLSGLLCRRCSGYCPNEKHGCCPNPTYDDAPQGPNGYNFDKCPASCGDGKCCKECCIKIPLISLNCPEDNVIAKPSLIPTVFGGAQCNKTFVLPLSCVSCGGLSTPIIKDWVACKMEPVAVWLKMLKFDFYNDWVSGSLYFPLIKRKYKLKKSKKKFGQIKKDKFCQYNCYDEFQGSGTYLQNAIIIKPNDFYVSSSISIAGCNATISAPIASEFYGEETSNATENLDKAAQDIVINGRNNNDDRCQIKFDDYSSLIVTFNSYNDITVINKIKESASIYAKPEYVKITDQFGNETWENQGGFGLNKNRCDRTRLVERKEFFKTVLDCEGSGSGAGTPLNFQSDLGMPSEDEAVAEDTGEDGGYGPSLSTGNGQPFGYCLSDDPCGVACGANGVSGCNAFCPCNNYDDEYGFYTEIIRHGLITWSDKKLYYSTKIESDSPSYNSNEYKANLMLPTTITELGSTTYCDIDGAPFVMDLLQPTTFQVSMESVQYKYNVGGGSANLRVINGNKDKEGGLNLRAYVSLSCTLVECMNTHAVVNQSQLGVDMIDSNDIDVPVGPCYLRFNHDVDAREYFCRRFSGYKIKQDNNGNPELGVHYVRPGGDDLDNTYDEYPEIRLDDGLTYKFTPENDLFPSEYNDGDLFVPGDACGYKNTQNNTTDYFYGLAPGRTDQLVNYPNTTNLTFVTNLDDEEQIDTGIDLSFTDISNLKGIRFNRSQTPYYFYFGLVPGKTSLHKTVGKFFADKINAATLQGLGASPDETSANEFGQNNIRNQVDSPYSILKTCLGQTQVPNPPIE